MRYLQSLLSSFSNSFFRADASAKFAQFVAAMERSLNSLGLRSMADSDSLTKSSKGSATERAESGGGGEISAPRNSNIERELTERRSKKAATDRGSQVVPTLQSQKNGSLRQWDGISSLRGARHARNATRELDHRGIFLAPVNRKHLNQQTHSKAEKIWTLAAALAAFGVLAVPGCGNSGGENALAQVKKPFGVGSTEKANAELEQAVRAKLDTDPRLMKSDVAVTADVTRNQVTLSGTVPSDDLRARAVELAKSAQAGVIVDNQLKLNAKGSGPVPMGKKSGYG
jgi:osmotically-inducible protein OsmY